MEQSISTIFQPLSYAKGTTLPKYAELYREWKQSWKLTTHLPLTMVIQHTIEISIKKESNKSGYIVSGTPP